MATIKIGDKEFKLKYTIESWKKLKETSGITPQNIEQKMNEELASTLSDLVYFGLTPADRESMKREILDPQIDFSVVDDIKAAVEECLPKAAKEKLKSAEATGEVVVKKN